MTVESFIDRHMAAVISSLFRAHVTSGALTLRGNIVCFQSHSNRHALQSVAFLTTTTFPSSSKETFSAWITRQYKTTMEE